MNAEDQVKWLHLESNPDVMTSFLTDIGMSAEWAVVDIVSIDEDFLPFVPQPVVAIIFLYPSSVHDDSEEGDPTLNESVFMIKQTIRNACGTVALFHAVGNNLDKIELRDGSPLKTYFDKGQALDPLEKGKLLGESTEIQERHDRYARQGQSRTPSSDEHVDNHFVALVERNGHLYRFNGSKSGPVDHGPSSPETFLYDASAVCRQFVSKHSDCINFSVLALVKPFD